MRKNKNKLRSMYQKIVIDVRKKLDWDRLKFDGAA